MDHDQDFSALRNLLATKKFDMPQDTQVEQFLTEFHTRQRAQLLAKPSLWSRATSWIQDRLSSLELAPTLSYGAAVAAIAITAMVGLSQQVQVTQQPGHSFQLSLRMGSHDNAFALIPAAFNPATTTASKSSDLTFTPNHSTDSATTRFVLASNSNGAHDSTVTF